MTESGKALVELLRDAWAEHVGLPVTDERVQEADKYGWPASFRTYSEAFHKGVEAAAALEAGGSDRVPEGWALVPKEPTNEMIAAGRDSMRSDIESGRKPNTRTANNAARNAYVTMLANAASPPAPTSAAGVDRG